MIEYGKPIRISELSRDEKKNIGFSRLVKAFPGMESLQNNEHLQQYKEYINSLKKWKK